MPSPLPPPPRRTRPRLPLHRRCRGKTDLSPIGLCCWYSCEPSSSSLAASSRTSRSSSLLPMPPDQTPKSPRAAPSALAPPPYAAAPAPPPSRHRLAEPPRTSLAPPTSSALPLTRKSPSCLLDVVWLLVDADGDGHWPEPRWVLGVDGFQKTFKCVIHTYMKRSASF